MRLVIAAAFCIAFSPSIGFAHDPKGLLTESKLKLKADPAGIASAVSAVSARDNYSQLRELLARKYSGVESTASIVSSLALSSDSPESDFTQVAQGFGMGTARWSPHKQVRVCFMDGEPDAWNNVFNVYSGILSFTSLTAENLGQCSTQGGDVRVSFETGDGYWSFVGIAANRVARNEPTLGLDGLGHSGPFSAEEKGKATHELLHSVGFEHEQQRPDIHCNWKTDQEIGALLGWDVATVQTNFKPIRTPSPILTPAVDKGSPMYYQLTGDFFTDSINDPCYQPADNITLTEIDIQTLKMMYPK